MNENGLSKPDIVSIKETSDNVYLVTSINLGDLGTFYKHKDKRYVFLPIANKFFKGWYLAQILNHLNFLNGVKNVK